MNFVGFGAGGCSKDACCKDSWHLCVAFAEAEQENLEAEQHFLHEKKSWLPLNALPPSNNRLLF